MTWRKEPPTHAEVRDLTPFWWHRMPDGTTHVLHLEASIGSDAIIDVLEQASSDCGGRFDPSDWPGEWTPCLPPLSEVKTMTAHMVDFLVAPYVASAKRTARRITALAMVPSIAAAIVSYAWFPAAVIAPFTIGVGTLSGLVIAKLWGDKL